MSAPYALWPIIELTTSIRPALEDITEKGKNFVEIPAFGSDDDFERSSTKKDPLKYVAFSPSLNNPSVDPLIGFSNKVAL